MNRLFRTSIAAVALAAFAVFGFAGDGRTQDAPKGDAAKGRTAYLAANCFTCHGRSGQGGAYNGPAPVLAKTAIPFEAFKYYVRAPAGDMPGYSEAMMSDQSMADVYAFVQSLAGRRDAKDIPLLND